MDIRTERKMEHVYKNNGVRATMHIIITGKTLQHVEEMARFMGTDDPSLVIKKAIRLLRQVKEGRKDIGM
jgi:hypothetical protein